ncbi:alpha/beta hydrolase [Candidatus Viridilinea mediisalina]|uniref:Serine aminopeptidase S33 domain-containing protein n=1 Tax=Candidatus Viridilinea mediisalina TaxID=2024553 RepID=A0A2A6RJ94_9CHLR|nr:alpha/beta hydrolase [Candidatus Viridilinea mediisalina]PDW02928.1 hypothetical protein CJ255_11425 [Candidatus Viridilinea mediisalina]
MSTFMRPVWNPDWLPGCTATTLELPPSYDGPCIATLVRRQAPRPNGRAVLYLHGFSDYFYQLHLAEGFAAHGYDFYALDLRRYGRSLLPHQRPNFCRDLREYFVEIDRAIEIINADWLLLNGHSTGGLLAALYAHTGHYYDRINALWLNSPFVEINAVGGEWAFAACIEQLGAVWPGFAVPGVLSSRYVESIHCTQRGHWNFDLNLKPLMGWPAYAGWFRAIRRAQRQLQAGFGISCPILLMHAARSHRGKLWSDAFTCSDSVLNIQHMLQYGPSLGRNVKLCAIEGGMHDLVLSAPPARAQVFAELFAWLDTMYDCRL